MPHNSVPERARRTWRIASLWRSAEGLLMRVAGGLVSRLWSLTPKSIDDLRKLTMNVLVVAAMTLIVIAVGEAFFERQAIIEPIAIPKSLEAQHGYTGSIVARRLIDQVEHINATARTRVERVKIGQESEFASLSSLQVPSSGLTLQTFISLLRTLFGKQEERIGGEITIAQSPTSPSRPVYQMLLRFDIARDTADRLGRPTDSRHFVKVVEATRINDLVDLAAQAIVENTTPVVLASYLHSIRKWKELDKLLDQLVVSSKPKILPPTLTLRGMRLLETCHLEDALKFLKTAAEKSDDGSAFPKIKYGDALVMAGKPEEAINEFKKAQDLKAGGLVYSSWAKALMRQNNPDAAIEMLKNAENVVRHWKRPAHLSNLGRHPKPQEEL